MCFILQMPTIYPVGWLEHEDTWIVRASMASDIFETATGILASLRERSSATSPLLDGSPNSTGAKGASYVHEEGKGMARD